MIVAFRLYSQLVIFLYCKLLCWGIVYRLIILWYMIVIVLIVQDSQGIIFQNALVSTKLIHCFLLFVYLLLSQWHMIIVLTIWQIALSGGIRWIYPWQIHWGLLLFFHHYYRFFSIFYRLTDQSIRLCPFNIFNIQAPKIRLIHDNATFLYFLLRVFLLKHLILLNFWSIENVGKMFFVG